MSDWLLWILMSATVYTLGRIIVLDTLIEEPRTYLLDWLTETRVGDVVRPVHRHETEWMKVPLWRRKTATLLQCPHCVCAWTAGGTVAVTDVWFADFPLPVLWWFGTWGGGLIFWAIIDSE